MRLQNRVALITGANNPMGIGAAIARDLAAEGVKVALTYKRISSAAIEPSSRTGTELYSQLRSDDARSVIDQLRAMQGIASAMEADLTDISSPRRVFDWVESTLGPVDILVNCAAHCELTGDSIETISPDGIDRTLSVNLRALLLMIQEFVKRHRNRSATFGRIINFSTDGARCFPGQIAYAASKSAVESLTRSIAKEVAAIGITVNAVAPGPVQTGYLTYAAARDIGQHLCGSRVGSPFDVAAAVLYFVLPSASWTTGQILAVAGAHDL